MPSPLHRFPEHLNALGRIVVEMASIEAHFVMMLQRILRVSEDTAIALLMSQLNTRGRIETIKQTARSVLCRAEYALVENVANDALKILSQRNDYVHNVWGISPDRRKVFRSTGVGKPPKEVVLSELEQMVAKLDNLSRRIIRLNNRLGRMRAHYKIDISHNIPEA